MFLMFLIACTAFFVSVEFSIIRVRSTRIDQLVEEKRKGAISAKKVISHLDEYLSACQLGTTITSLILGWIGESTTEKLLNPLFEHISLDESVLRILSIAIAFCLITFLNVVVGELAPKTVAIQKSETIVLLFSKPMIWFYTLTYPFIWTLNQSSRLVTRVFGINSTKNNELAHTEEELRIILSESYEKGEINQTELKYMNNIFEFDNKIAKEIMMPRTEIVSLSIDGSISDILKLYKDEKYTRYPVTNNGDKDSILGVVNIKDLLSQRISKPNVNLTVSDIMKPVIQVIETIPIQELLIKMQQERNHMAILIDEYGGTSGLVTAEDIIEEIVGEIRDEFDTDEIPAIRKINENHYILDGKVLIEEVNELLNINIQNETDTIGGWFLTQKMEPESGSQIEMEELIFTIKDINGLHIKYIEVEKAIHLS